MRPPAEHGVGVGGQCPEPPPQGLLPDLLPQASFLLRSCENPAEAAEGLAVLRGGGSSGRSRTLGMGTPSGLVGGQGKSAGRR